MTPGARIQSAIELLDAILTSWQSEKRIPADKLVDQHFRARRFIGSKDRAHIGELTYWCLRHLGTLSWWAEKNRAAELSRRQAKAQREAEERPQAQARALVFAALILRGDFNRHSILMLANDGKYAPPPITAEEKSLCAAVDGKPVDFNELPGHAQLNYPEWMQPVLQESLGSEWKNALKALSGQAPTDLRVNTLKTDRDTLATNLRKEGFDTSPTPLSDIGLRLEKRAPIFTSRWFKEGHFEVQDEGSQLVAKMVDAEPGMKVIDFCAGAGGKTLAIAAAMQNKGRILAWDTSEKRLAQTPPRLRRAGVHNVQTHMLSSEQDGYIKRHKLSADRVLVDAPCSGTGTWRRNPDLKWRFTQKDLEEMTALQQAILQSASRLVKPGGRLIYATCSLLKEENDKQIDQFLTNSKDFKVVCAKKIWDKNSHEAHPASYLWVTPHQDGVDGFFAAILERQ